MEKSWLEALTSEAFWSRKRNQHWARPRGIFVQRWAEPKPPSFGPLVMHVASAFGIFHDIRFFSCEKGKCKCNFVLDDCLGSMLVSIGPREMWPSKAWIRICKILAIIDRCVGLFVAILLSSEGRHACPQDKLLGMVHIFLFGRHNKLKPTNSCIPHGFYDACRVGANDFRLCGLLDNGYVGFEQQQVQADRVQGTVRFSLHEGGVISRKNRKNKERTKNGCSRPQSSAPFGCKKWQLWFYFVTVEPAISTKFAFVSWNHCGEVFRVRGVALQVAVIYVTQSSTVLMEAYARRLQREDGPAREQRASLAKKTWCNNMIQFATCLFGGVFCQQGAFESDAANRAALQASKQTFIN